VSEPCTVIIGAVHLLPALKQRVGDANGEVLAFPDADALRALEAITARRPHVIVLERLFSVSPRGTALINRIKADPSLRQAEIRVFAHDSDYTRVVPRAPAPTPEALDQGGTRRAPRFTMAAKVLVKVDGRPSRLVDLSIVGAQVLSPGKLKPSQTVAFALTDDLEEVRCTGTVAWTKFETGLSSAPVYRSGIDFVDADAAMLDAFCARHKASPRKPSRRS
jgi:hypothetical protein